jgi:predicted ATP-grasp superfamily ATP-dependent carboligase
MESEHRMNKFPAAVIAGAYQTGVLAVRSLKRRGINAICFDNNSANPGFQSVYGPALKCPNPDDESKNWLDFMLELSKNFKDKPVLLASSDKFVSSITNFAEHLKEYYIISAGIQLQGLLAEKQSQYELASKHGMPMPKTGFIHSLKAATQFGSHAKFPCLIKPIHFREWQKFNTTHQLYDKKIVVVKNTDELIEMYIQASRVNPNVIMQEIISGPDTNKRVYLAYYNENKDRIANAMFRELRCSPMGFGPASVSEPVEDIVTDKICDKFLKDIGYIGVCEIEMKWDDRDGKVKLIEANPRLSGGGDAAPYAGVDLPWIHYMDLVGEVVKPVKPNNKIFKHIVLRSEGSVIPEYWFAGKLKLKELLNSYRPPLAFFDLDKKDLRYSLETIYIFFRLLFRGIYRYLIKREKVVSTS